MQVFDSRHCRRRYAPKISDAVTAGMLSRLLRPCLMLYVSAPTRLISAVTVGHWSSLLLKAADVEATRGHKGSSKIRVEAFMTLRVLLGTTDQLAFFLPGVVSQIGKVFHVSKTMISQAAGSMEAMDHALRALTKFLMIVLQDEANISSLDNSDIDLNMDKSPLSFLEELRHLKKQDHSQLVEKKSIQESSQSDVSKSFQEGETGDHGCYTRILDHMQSRTKGKQTNASVRMKFAIRISAHSSALVYPSAAREKCASAIPTAADSTVSIFDVETDRQTHSFHSLELWNMTENKRMTVQAHDTITSALAQSHVTGMVYKSRQFC
nr:hypothetical protein [Tanacetum cinerariifolium]